MIKNKIKNMLNQNWKKYEFTNPKNIFKPFKNCNYGYLKLRKLFICYEITDVL